ncbi:MAG: acetate--CoA ligase [Proteobacteria bacterium]|nr:acetate--CoA ligase [Pseudomonadota bacterium]MBU1387033.1 acetate--CoA ligase [Pseudomonadota bacterium]MBU1542286.1 acetate--CoA ligase [Pseudomonadota bacterium]MBU2431448.1 acetate--CoA ligase [Pseudomonadota bacterium]MBU2479799.1 acetate--CoA ligase [Pseudomonadota bacterium]
MSKKDVVETTEAQIAVHWKEEDYYYPSKEFIAQANLTDKGIYDRFSLSHFPDYFTEYADLLTWYKKWDQVLDTSDAPCYKWFKGGQINASFNCIDRHLKDNKNKTAIHFVPELEQEKTEHITYQELYVRVNEFAAVLKDFAGLKRGDRVTIHMPMSAELPITMLACARIGVIHSVVFGGFSASACADRIVDSNSRVLITMDAYYRGGKLLNHKINADEAVKISARDGQVVDKVLVWQRYPGKSSTDTPMVKDRDFFINDLLPGYYGKRIEPEKMLSEDPLFLMYTSGTTGKPKGCQHGTGGYLAYVTAMSKYIQDIHPEDVYWCMADIGWITGHSFIVYGPLALCASTVIYEGVPTYPDAGRSWRIAQELDVNIFHTAPTAIRALRKLGPDEPAKYTYHFKHMTTVGEPIEPAVWKWYESAVGKGEAIIVDTWWQTETGGFLCSTVPGINPMKPGSAGPGVPGIHPIILDDDGNEITGPGIAGNICIQNPWPGMLQTVWGNRDRFVETYFARYCKNPDSKDWRDWPYLAGDAAMRAEDGYYRILGRIDDVINVSGHRLGTKEIESAAMMVNEVAEAAVVPVAHEIKGREPDLYIALKPGVEPTEAIARKISDAICDQIGKIAKPRKVWLVPDMPKTRSGKIMRRVLGAISNRGDVGNVMTLANPEVVEEIRKMVQK